jgi:lipopolysaccharide/colanic/teichoic acid biosynthesis glycosyltransferase
LSLAAITDIGCAAMTEARDMQRLKLLILDLLLIAVATVLALVLRDNLEFSTPRHLAIMPYLVMTLLSAIVILPLAGINRTIWRFSGLPDYGRLVLSCIAIVLVAVTFGFATLRLEGVPRSLPIIQGILMIALLVGVRVLMRARRLRRNDPQAAAAPGDGRENVLVLGLNSVAELFIQAVAENPTSNIEIAGLIGRSERHTGQLIRGYAVLGTPEEISHVIAELEVHGVNIDRIIVTLPLDRLSQDAQNALQAIEDGCQIRIDYFAERLGFTARAAASEAQVGQDPPVTNDATKTLSFEPELIAALQKPYWKFKRAFDFSFALCLLLALAPFMALIAIANAIVHGLPIVFWQQRPGQYRRPFRVYKFRSLLAAHDEFGQRLPDDLRSTWLGRFLRATRLDELPQLVNILRGHMSFIGPRPLLGHDQLEQFKGRLLVKPGLTGWAQVNGGKTVLARDKMALDIWYIRNASFWLDLKIFIMTVKMVMFGEQENQAAVEQAWIDLNQSRA